MELSVFDHKDYVTCVKYHPNDCNLFVTGSSNILMGWDSRSPKPIRRFTYKDRFGQVCYYAKMYIWNSENHEMPCCF